MLDLQLQPCLPPRWASGGHQQTVLGHLWPSPRLENKGQRIEIPVSGDDRLVGLLTPGKSKVVIYLFHGLAGSVDSSYMHRTAIHLGGLGHSIFMVNHRACGEGAGLASLPYHSGRAEDLSSAIEVGRSRFPEHKHLAIGFSLSGNALLLLMTGKRGTTQPDMAFSVNAPIDLHQAARALREGFNRVYDLKFYLQCRRDVLYSRKKDAPKVNIPRLATLHDFDNLYTAPAGGFKNREDYYSSCSTVDLLDQIQRPTLLLTAKDDPFVGYESYARAPRSPATHLHIEDFGGHMGYISRETTPLGTKRWLDYAVVEGVKALLKSSAHA
jgi:predicted alpha/beta-fold hydrolase